MKTVYETTDGRQFEDQNDADAHQEAVNKLKIADEYVEQAQFANKAQATRALKTIRRFLVWANKLPDGLED